MLHNNLLEIENGKIGLLCTLEDVKCSLEEYGYTITKIRPYEYSKIGFLVGTKLLVFRRVLNVKLVG